MKVNGAEVEGLVEPRTLLVHFIRENLQLTGTHIGCETTHCGACTVDIDGMSVKSCTMFAVQAEGVRDHDDRGHGQCRRHAVGAAGRLSHDARAAMRLLHAGHDPARAPAAEGKPQPSEEEIRVGISGNLCRCTGYQNIVKAIQYAAAKINGTEFKEAAE